MTLHSRDVDGHHIPRWRSNCQPKSQATAFATAHAGHNGATT